ncbi:MAG: terminase [Patescibacteria group bacterium]|nr:terminase [Patescibacteria group bacterium]
MPTRGQTPLLKKKFLEHFRLTGNVTKASEQTPVDRKSVYAWRLRDKSFADAFARAETESTERLEAEAQRRAAEGWDEPVYQGGQMVGTVRKYSDTLLIFLLKGRAPEKYREMRDVRHSGEVSQTLRIVVDDDDDAPR